MTRRTFGLALAAALSTLGTAHREEPAMTTTPPEPKPPKDPDPTRRPYDEPH